MELKEYVQAALVTESRIDEVKVNDLFAFKAVLNAFIAAGSMLDLYKKNIFYGKPMNEEKWFNAKRQLEGAAEALGRGTYLPLSYSSNTVVEIDPRLFHAIVGIATESTELIEAVSAHIDETQTLDLVNVQEELGDLNWYQAIAVDAMKTDWELIQETNIDKLWRKKGARYDGRFSSAKAINRDTEKEREILVQGDARARVEEGYPFGGSDFT
jgi:NTP pyrophosphatase (non-canonical NTP hydrolase)